jgi:outer membrane protein
MHYNHTNFKVSKILLITVFLIILNLFINQQLWAVENEQSTSSNPIILSLNEAILMAIRSNKQIENAYLDRVLQKFNFKIAKNEFFPKISLSGSADYQNSRSEGSNSISSKNSSGNSSATLSINEKIPTGANLSFAWQTGFGISDSNSGNSNNYSNSWTISFNQPLLKGAGIDVNTASYRRSEINEKQNILNLKSSLTSTVNSVISAYRNLHRASRQVEISKNSLKRSKDLLKKNKLLIKVGRMAAIELIQAKTEIARNELSYQQTLNHLDNARLNLIRILNIDRNQQVTTEKKVNIQEITPDFETCLAAALNNRVDYQSALLTQALQKLNMVVARNSQLYDLNLTSSFSMTDSHSTSSDTDNKSWTIGLNFSVPVYGDLTRKQTIISSKISRKKQLTSIENLKENITIEVQDAIRDVKMQLIQVKFAKQTHELTKEKLSIEQEKLNLGMTSNFQIVQSQNDLVRAQTSELDAKISYLNTLTNLDRIIGTTLETWKIDFNNKK